MGKLKMARSEMMKKEGRTPLHTYLELILIIHYLKL